MCASIAVVPRNRYSCSLSPDHPAVAEVKPGEIFKIECPSALGGILDSTGQPSETEPSANPMTGPIFIKGVKPGDSISVHIRSIKPVGFGKAQNIIYSQRKNRLEFLEKMSVPVDPSIGCIGVAPRISTDTTTNDTCGSHGGNLDCRDAAAGAYIFLRARRAGALLGMGDVHWAMGDGEIGGQGVEGAADVTLRVLKSKSAGIEWPWILRDGWIMTLGGYSDLKTAQRIAYEEMMTLTRALFNFERSEVQARIAAAGYLKVCQACCPVITVRVCLPLELFEISQKRFLKNLGIV
jgi:amidase